MSMISPTVCLSTSKDVSTRHEIICTTPGICGFSDQNGSGTRVCVGGHLDQVACIQYENAANYLLTHETLSAIVFSKMSCVCRNRVFSSSNRFACFCNLLSLVTKLSQSDAIASAKQGVYCVMIRGRTGFIRMSRRTFCRSVKPYDLLSFLWYPLLSRGRKSCVIYLECRNWTRRSNDWTRRSVIAVRSLSYSPCVVLVSSVLYNEDWATSTCVLKIELRVQVMSPNCTSVCRLLYKIWP